MRWCVALFAVVTLAARLEAPPAPPELPFAKGQAIDLDRVIPANERGILCLTVDEKGRVYGGTTGGAAHLFVYDPATGTTSSLARLEGGIGFAYALIRLPDGSLIAGTQADPTGTAVQTDPKAVGRLYRFVLAEGGVARVEELGIPVAGQGIYTLAYDAKSNTLVGNTWPDGHFFSYDLKTRTFKGHGAIAGYRTFEEPRHAADLNRGTKENVRYPRQVSRAIVIDPGTAAYTAGAKGVLYRYDFQARRLEKLALSLPAVPGREAWASLDAAVMHQRAGEDGEYSSLMGGTSDGYLFELRIHGKDELLLRPRGRPHAQGTIQGLVRLPSKGGKGHTFVGVAGNWDGMPRGFTFAHGGSTSAVIPHGIPIADGQPSMVGFGALAVDGEGTIYAGERDRIARLIRYPAGPAAKPKPARKERAGPPKPPPGWQPEIPTGIVCKVVFAPEGTTTDGSGYTAMNVGLDGNVYVGSTRYGGYAWLLRFDPRTGKQFMQKIVNMQQLSGEMLVGINTQGKIHGLIIIGPDGRIWFVSKQAHEIFGTRPEYAEEPKGYPGGHLCFYDPKTGFSRSVGILKRQEGLMGGVMDTKRNRLYYRTEPKNILLSYDIDSGKVTEHGHIGAACRYMAIDNEGAVYSTGRGDYLARFDPKTGHVEDLKVRVEGPGTYSAPYVIRMGPNGKLYGAGISHPWVMEFDIANYKKGPFPEVVVRNVAPAAPEGLPVQDIHAGVFGKDGKFYYSLATTGPLTKGGKSERHLRVMRFDPKTGKSETVGVPDVSKLDESKVKHAYVRGDRYQVDHIQGMSVGEDGSLYMMDIYPQLNVVCFPKLTAPR
ncbi:MAG: SMP-30/gluconolactonase/LRE family protein [Gemmataceae bacterium]|nr:SMP-30/gluconolactonase/LRE family protein [Gemmataceae bacterium]